MTSQSRRRITSIPVATSAPLSSIRTGWPVLHPTSSLQTLEKESSLAIISINTFTLHDPPLPLQFGQFKKLNVDLEHVQRLTQRFRHDRFKPFMWNSMIPILLSRRDLEPDCINTDVTLGYLAPTLTLSEVGLGRDDIIVCDGYHRYCAVKQITKKLKGKIGCLSTDIDNNNRMVLSGCLDQDEIATAVEESSELWERIETLEEEHAQYETWGVVVYDIGMLSIHMCETTY